MDSEDNVLEIRGGPDSERTLLASLVSDYEHCNERRRSAIRRFARNLAEMDSPHLCAQIIPFPPL